MKYKLKRDRFAKWLRHLPMERKFLDLKLDSNPLCCFHRGGAVVMVTKKSIVEALVVKGKNIVGYCVTPLAKLKVVL